MGTVQLLHRPLEGTIMKVVIALSLISVVAGAGYIRPHCTKQLETITVKKCRLEYDEACESESKVVGQRVTYEKGDCKEVEVCKPAVFVTKYGLHRHFGKREAEPGYVHTECEKVTKEVCKQVPVKTDVGKEFEKCTKTPKECARMLRPASPKVTCEKLKH